MQKKQSKGEQKLEALVLGFKTRRITRSQKWTEIVNQIKDITSFLDPESNECRKFVRKHKEELVAYFATTWGTARWPALTKPNKASLRKKQEMAERVRKQKEQQKKKEQENAEARRKEAAQMKFAAYTPSGARGSLKPPVEEPSSLNGISPVGG